MLKVIDIDGKNFKIDKKGFIKKFNPEWIANNWGMLIK